MSRRKKDLPVDEYMAQYDCSEFQKLRINAPAEALHEAALKLDLSNSKAIRFLFF
ncbi:MAG: hypothetical protein ACYCXE_05620 [Thermoleophilia bacterium]